MVLKSLQPGSSLVVYSSLDPLLTSAWLGPILEKQLIIPHLTCKLKPLKFNTPIQMPTILEDL